MPVYRTPQRSEPSEESKRLPWLIHIVVAHLTSPTAAVILTTIGGEKSARIARAVKLQAPVVKRRPTCFSVSFLAKNMQMRRIHCFLRLFAHRSAYFHICCIQESAQHRAYICPNAVSLPTHLKQHLGKLIIVRCGFRVGKL